MIIAESLLLSIESLLVPLQCLGQARTRGTGRAFLSFFPLLISLGASTLSWDRPGRRAKGELATSRHHADYGQENWAKCTPP